MKARADAVEWLDIQCPECRSIADRIVRGESLLYPEKQHIEQHVVRTRVALRSRGRPPRVMVGEVCDRWRAVMKNLVLIRRQPRRGSKISVPAGRS